MYSRSTSLATRHRNLKTCDVVVLCSMMYCVDLDMDRLDVANFIIAGLDISLNVTII